MGETYRKDVENAEKNYRNAVESRLKALQTELKNTKAHKNTGSDAEKIRYNNERKELSKKIAIIKIEKANYKLDKIGDKIKNIATGWYDCGKKANNKENSGGVRFLFGLASALLFATWLIYFPVTGLALCLRSFCLFCK